MPGLEPTPLDRLLEELREEIYRRDREGVPHNVKSQAIGAGTRKMLRVMWINVMATYARDALALERMGKGRG